MTEIAGARVLITGAASGLGRLMALGMSRLGGRIVAWDLDEPGVKEIAGRITDEGGHAQAYVCDVSDRRRVAETADRVRREAGTVDVLVNNAGIISGRPLLELTDEQIERTFGVNTLAHYWTTRAFLPAMVDRNHGHVVTVASAAGWIGVARQTDYAASKWAAVGFDESLRQELRRTAPGVRTTVVCPYYVNTGMFPGVTTRFSWLLPILDEQAVVTKIVDAVLRDRRRLLVPSVMVLSAPVLRFLPVEAFDAVADFLGLNDALEGFVGGTQPAAERATVTDSDG